MPRRLVFLSLTTFVTLLTLGTAVAQAAAVPSTASYAEGLYAEFAAGTGGKIAFQLATLDRGPLTSVQSVAFSSLLTAPAYRIETSDHGTELLNPRFDEPQEPGYNLHDMASSVDKFQTAGYPVSEGVYRRLSVTATIGAESRQYQSLEFCWPALGHCAVLDPAVVFLQSKVDNRLRLASEGWGPQITLSGEGEGIVTPAGRCGLSSHHNWIGETITWKAYTATYKDIFGFTLVTKHLGLQQYGTSCDVNCRPAPFSRSDSSSANGTAGWTTACARTGGATGHTGRTSRSIGETKCTHKFVQHASASVTIKGSGASISADWTLGGGVDSNGGVYTDTCGYF